MNRRTFLARSGVLGLTAVAPLPAKVARQSGVRLKLGLNAYSFDKALRGGTMSLFDVVHFCAEQGVDALDATGYYFPGYPAVPPDEYIFRLKRTAFVNGVAISGTGVRNDFAVADPTARKKDVQLVKDWIVVASKLGAPLIRVFSGRVRPEGYTFDQSLAWMVDDFKECTRFGQQHGVMVGLQHHNDFLKTADETIRVIEAVGSDWFGCILDVGSLRQGDPYAEIEKLLPYTVSWQIKEEVAGKPTDLARIRAIIDRSGYRGYIPFEALGPGDARPRVIAFLGQIRKAFLL